MKIIFTQFTFNNFFTRLLLSCLCVVTGIVVNGQQYTEIFSSSPTLTPDPITPTWMEKASVTLGRTVYDFVTGGNGGWEYKASGGAGNSANLFYSTAATTTVTIKRRDGKRFQFYGAWLNYTNFTDSYTAPWMRVTYEGSTTPFASYGSNSTIILSQNVNVTSVSIYFSGLHTLNFDNVIVGAAVPIPPLSATNEIVNYTETSALLSGSVTDDGGSSVSESGIVYGLTPSPTVTNTKLSLGTGVSSFSQTVSGLQPNTTYYVRSYATNSAGTAYGNEQSFTTFGAFVTTGSHNFNTNWASSINQPSPFTKYVEGWDVSGRSTGSGVISVYRITDSDAAEGAASLRVADDEYSESLMYLSMKTHNNAVFNLKSFAFRYDAQQIDEGAAYGTITVTGYRNGLVVPGAVQNITGISPLSTEASYHTFSASNNIFDGIDEFRITTSDAVNGARLYGFDLDAITTANNTTLPVTFSSVRAYNKNTGIQVEWKVALESNVDHYEVEKSPDGLQFFKATELSPRDNNYSAASYDWFDKDITSDKNYYRIKPVFKTGKFSYSQVMIIASEIGVKGISVYPNPVAGSTFNVRLSNQSKGTYNVVLFDIKGQQVFSTKIIHPGGSLTQTVELDNRFTKGIYQLKVKGAGKSYIQQIVKN